MCGCNCNDAYELPKGEKGEPGSQGEKGDIGNTGPDGNIGLTGLTGAAGVPAFKYFKTVVVPSQGPNIFISNTNYNDYISGNLTDSKDGAVATAVDYTYIILRFDPTGAVWKNALLDNSVTDVEISTAGIMTATVGDLTLYGNTYRIIITG